MDGSGSLLTRLRAALVAYDDEALAALANKGLVRRARKDLETIHPDLASADDPEWLSVKVADVTVRLTLPPNRSRCSCPAGGICRHLLAVLIFVKEFIEIGTDENIEEESASTAVIPGAELLALDDDAIARWAGKPLVTRVKKLLAQGLPVEFEETAGLSARLPTRNTECRWMPGQGLDGMVCSCHAATACEHRVAAVLAFQIARGTRVLDDRDDPVLGASVGSPRTREEVLASVGVVVTEMVALGLSRLSQATADRLRTLAVSAHGVEFPRLERLLRSLAALSDQVLAREAQADSAVVMTLAARVEALRRGLSRQATTHLVGQHKTSYEPVGTIELVGLGARAWHSPSGFAGLTLYFWDRSTRNWATWTDSRPLSVERFDPVARYRGDGPWEALGSPEHASRRILRLSGAWRNRQGRLSGRPSTRGLVLGLSGPELVPARIDRFDVLNDRARLLFGGGFRDRSEQDEIVLLAPARWGPALFDEVRQELVRVVLDRDGRPLPLVLRQTKENEQAITILQEHDSSATHSVLGLLRLGADRLAVEPIALHCGTEQINLTVDQAPAGPRPLESIGDVSIEEEEADLETAEDLEPSRSNLGRLLGLIDTRLLAIGEGGVAAFRDVPELRALGLRAGALGLTCCEAALGRVVSALEAQRRGELTSPTTAALEVLAAYHVVRLALMQESIAVATSALSVARHTSPSSPPTG